LFARFVEIYGIVNISYYYDS